MTDITSETVLGAFLVFCRIGGCLLIVPGFSSMRIPVQIRLFLAVAVSLSLTPVLLPFVTPVSKPADPARLFAAIGSEAAIGFTIGLLARLMFMALQTMAVAVAQAVGLGGMIAGVADNGEQQPAVATLFTMTATMMIFAADQHWELLRGLKDSYSVLSPAGGFSARLALVDVTDQLTDAFLLTLRITSPFLIYSVIVNLAVGITNKLTPQIPIYFIAMPFVTAGGLLLLYFSIAEVLTIFSAAFGTWLQQG
ncbi:flagellar biosynthesis protein FliR [Amorphus sp. 3PC139-8]|uniref:flagellar biosynthesis protein FliR n=1 Tax=Amorphus sp. 3PC139-8 TaxID=2735676 RepID=UPI00345CD0D6